MTIEQALKIKQNWTAEQARNDLERFLLRDERPANKVIALACKALEKQIPEKVVSQFESHAIYDNVEYIDQLDIATFKCPMCGCVLACGEIDMSDYSNCLYCDKCGQKLDWSDTE